MLSSLSSPFQKHPNRSQVSNNSLSLVAYKDFQSFQFLATKGALFHCSCTLLHALLSAHFHSDPNLSHLIWDGEGSHPRLHRGGRLSHRHLPPPPPSPPLVWQAQRLRWNHHHPPVAGGQEVLLSLCHFVFKLSLNCLLCLLFASAAKPVLARISRNSCPGFFFSTEVVFVPGLSSLLFLVSILLLSVESQ